MISLYSSRCDAKFEKHKSRKHALIPHEMRITHLLLIVGNFSNKIRILDIDFLKAIWGDESDDI